MTVTFDKTQFNKAMAAIAPIAGRKTSRYPTFPVTLDIMAEYTMLTFGHPGGLRMTLTINSTGLEGTTATCDFYQLRKASVHSLESLELIAAGLADYGLYTDRDVTSVFSLVPKNFLKYLRKVSYAMSKEETRPQIGCVLFQNHENQLRLVATDGHRLACIDTGESVAAHFPDISVSRDIIKSLLKALPLVRGDIQLSIGQTAFRVTGKGLDVETKGTGMAFPDYARVIPRQTGIDHIIVKKSALYFIKEVEVQRKKNTRIDKETYTDKEYRISHTTGAITLEGGKISYQQTYRTIYTGVGSKKGTYGSFDAIELSGAIREDQAGLSKVGMNSNYLKQALKVMDGTHITLQSDDAGAALVLREENATHIIMPTRL